MKLLPHNTCLIQYPLSCKDISYIHIMLLIPPSLFLWIEINSYYVNDLPLRMYNVSFLFGVKKDSPSPLLPPPPHTHKKKLPRCSVSCESIYLIRQGKKHIKKNMYRYSEQTSSKSNLAGIKQLSNWFFKELFTVHTFKPSPLPSTENS